MNSVMQARRISVGQRRGNPRKIAIKGLRTSLPAPILGQSHSIKSNSTYTSFVKFTLIIRVTLAVLAGFYMVALIT